MIAAPIEYVRAGSVEEALEALEAPEAKLLAGGQSLLPAMKLRVAQPSLLVDIGRLELRGIEERDGRLAIGALTTWDELERVQRPALRAIGECAQGIGDLQVRNLGTLGGSLAHADPAADMPAVLLALGATVGLRSREGERELPVSALLLGPFLTALAEGELITEVRVPLPVPGSGSAYVAIEHPASGFALAGAAALVTPEGTGRVALTGVAATPFLLDGDPDEAIERAELYGDRFAPVQYRRQLSRTLGRRALERARARADEDETWTA